MTPNAILNHLRPMIRRRDAEEYLGTQTIADCRAAALALGRKPKSGADAKRLLIQWVGASADAHAIMHAGR
jgi:hypothetical protein